MLTNEVNTKVKVLCVRTPRLVWAYVNEDDNFMPPLNFSCLAAYTRERLPEVEFTIVDCCVERMGWKSLEEYIKKNRYDILAMGDETFNVDNAYRCMGLVKKYHPETTVVAGGRHFPYMAEESFESNVIDYIVKGEGEITFVEFLKQFMSATPDFRSVTGMKFRENGSIVDTGWRPLIEDLDDLPLPAYDLLKMDAYSHLSRMWPKVLPFYHSRGCTHGCNYCTFWPQMARWKYDVHTSREVPLPTYRTKSPKRTVDELEYLTKKYDRDFIHFIDGTWDEDTAWNEAFSEEILSRDLKISWWAYHRADNVLRDEKLGVFEKIVKAGLRHPLLGAERNDLAGNLQLNKRVAPDDVKAVFDLFEKKYPMLVRHVTFMAGLRIDTKETLKNLFRYAKTFKSDVCSLLFVCPMPGTDFYNEAKEKGWLKVHDWSKYHWFEPIMETETMSLEELKQNWYFRCLTVNFSNFWWRIKRQFSPHPYIRSINSYGREMARCYLRVLIRGLFRKTIPFRAMAEPDWYNS